MPIEIAPACLHLHRHWHLRLRFRVALAAALAVLIAGCMAAAALLWALSQQNDAQAQQGQQAIARSAAHTLAAQTTRAIRLGIPLEKLPGVTEYLELTMDHTPQLAYLALADVQGRPLHSASRGNSLSLIKLPISYRGQEVAQIHAGAQQPHVHGLLKPALLSVALILLMSALAGAVSYFWPGAWLQQRHHLLLSALRDGQSLPVQEEHSGDALQAALQTLGRLQQRNQQAQQAVSDYAAELMAVDFDQKMHLALTDIAQDATKSGIQQ